MAKASVTWFEIMGTDSARLQKFYRELFDWKMTPPIREMGNYSMLQAADAKPGIGGGIGEGPARVSMYVEVADPQSYVDKAVASGAQLIMPVTTITPTTTIAMLTDPAGNTFGILKAQPAPRKTAARSAAKPTPGAAKKAARPRAAKKRTTAKKTTKRAGGRR